MLDVSLTPDEVQFLQNVLGQINVQAANPESAVIVQRVLSISVKLTVSPNS